MRMIVLLTTGVVVFTCVPVMAQEKVSILVNAETPFIDEDLPVAVEPQTQELPQEEAPVEEPSKEFFKKDIKKTESKQEQKAVNAPAMPKGGLPHP